MGYSLVVKHLSTMHEVLSMHKESRFNYQCEKTTLLKRKEERKKLKGPGLVEQCLFKKELLLLLLPNLYTLHLYVAM